MRCRSNAAAFRPCVAARRRAVPTAPSTPSTTPRGCRPCPVVTQPSPYRAASRRERGPLAAMMNGVRGCCTGPGRVRASTAEKYVPSMVTWSPVSSRSSSPVNSWSRSTRCRGVSGSPRGCGESMSPPVADAEQDAASGDVVQRRRSRRNVRDGGSWGRSRTSPRPIRRVTIAAAVSVDTVPNQGRVGQAAPRQVVVGPRVVEAELLAAAPQRRRLAPAVLRDDGDAEPHAHSCVAAGGRRVAWRARRGERGRCEEGTARCPLARTAPASSAWPQAVGRWPGRSQVSASVSTTLGGVPRVCRGPSTHCTAPNGGTRTSTLRPGARWRELLERVAHRRGERRPGVAAGSARQASSACRPSGSRDTAAGWHGAHGATDARHTRRRE